MESKAVLRYARLTPRKAKRVLDLIKGKHAGEALLSLRFMPYRAARYIEKILKSAMHNAEQKDSNIDSETLIISKAFVEQGPVMKRLEPRAMGRANILKKKSCHITVILTEK